MATAALNVGPSLALHQNPSSRSVAAGISRGGSAMFTFHSNKT